MANEIDAENRAIRVWCDGCFDLVHYGHANSMRQAKLMGDVLVVGIHDDDAISRNKGIPVFSQDQRYKMVRGIKWVDEIVEGSTYFPTAQTLKEHNCDFAAHGDDLSITADMQDPYQPLKDANLLKIFKRTEGVSTTDIVSRMLQCVKSHTQTNGHCMTLIKNDCNGKNAEIPASKFLQTSTKIWQFSNGKESKPNEKVVYVPGNWDLFHPGHLDFLKAASKEGDYLLVGIYPDFVSRKRKGPGYPIMNLHERTLSILACKYVSDVVIGAPYEISIDMMKQLKIDLVCHGFSDHGLCMDPFVVPKSEKKFKFIETGNPLTTSCIIKTFAEKISDYEARNADKTKRETNNKFSC